MASIAWAEAYNNGTKTVKGLTTAVNDALTENNVDLSKYTVTVTDKGADVAIKDIVVATGWTY